MDDLARIQLENKKLRQRCEELDEIEDQLQLYETENKAAKTKIDAIQKKSNNLQKENQELLDKLTKLSEDKNILTKKISDFRLELSEAQSENKQRAQTEIDLNIELQERDLLINELKSNVNLKNSNGQQDSELEELQLKVNVLVQENEEAYDCLKQADKQVEQFSLEKQQLQEQVEMLTAKLQSGDDNEKVQEKNSPVQELTQKLYKSNALVQKYEKENEKLRSDLNELTMQMEKIIQTHKIELLELTKQLPSGGKADDEAIKELMLENKKIKKRNKKLKEELAGAQKFIEELRAANG